MLKNIGIIILSKIIFFFIKFFSLGSGSTWPGEIALTLNSNFINEILNSSPMQVIVIAGTNGKTTTATLLKSILENQGKKVIHNEEGANLLNGIASTLIKNSNLFGNFDFQYAIFEVDENTLPLFLKTYTPEAVVILNLFRDQLDRYGEVNTIAHNWHNALKKLSSKVKLFLNADDPQIRYLAEEVKATVYFFGLKKTRMKKKQLSHDVDSIYCPGCGEKLKYEAISYSHLGDYHCLNCRFNRGIIREDNYLKIKSKLKGVYNQYNIKAVFLVSKILFSIPKKIIIKSIENFTPAFGRQEKINIKERELFILLSKNPTGFNQSIDMVAEMLAGKKTNMLLILNDRVPDGRDVSWIWDVDFEKIRHLAELVFVAGDRPYDLALRLVYADVPKEKIRILDKGIKQAVEEAISTTAKRKQIFILATYSAMLEVRKAVVGRKFL